VNENGFTLIELLVVIGLISILAGIAFFSSRGVMDGYQVKGAARQVYSDMQLARLSAIREGKQWSVCVNPDDTFTSYTIQNSAGTTVKTIDIASMYKGMTFSENLGSACFLFKDNGTASSGNVTVSKGARSVLITVNSSTGNIRIN